ncbi:MAG: hypothetical protein LUF82_00075 [Clostridia bacterium]|nr:hypothetical protein [Clostridia bacterium]
MDSTKEEALAFLDKCKQLKTSKFIMATAGIKDILKSIVNSQTLYELFHEVTKNFDYIAAKRACFVTVQDGFLKRSCLKLPESVGDRLAFIFCLLVEFDNDTLNFTEFLQQFFAEDGSYFASFHSFCDKVIVSLEDIIKEVFKEELSEAAAEPADANTEQDSALVQKLAVISMLIAHEKEIVMQSGMPPADIKDGICILTELDSAMQEGRLQSVEASLCGYEYFSRCHNNFSRFIDLLTAEIN